MSSNSSTKNTPYNTNDLSSNKSDDSLISIFSYVASTIALSLATGCISYMYAKKQEEAKYSKLHHEEYLRKLQLKEKTRQIRKASGEPESGTLLEDVTIDKVYLWEIEDLRKRFPGPKNKIENKMMFKTGRNHSGSEEKGAADKSRYTEYNKLITDHECILASVIRKPNMNTSTIGYMRAGPRRYLHFDPTGSNFNVAVVTCGGLCPGLNNVVREITKTLHQLYGVGGKVYGIQGGYAGFYTENTRLQPVELTPKLVENIHHSGGTVLGSSRGGFDLDKILHFITSKKISQLYVLGGDGTHRGAFRIHEGCMEAGLNVAVACIPKTIDNDVDLIDHSFGFSSAVEAAQLAIRTAKTEAVCNIPNGIGIVKLMGRSSGYIAAHATMSSTDVDLCLVPEVPIVLEGENGCLPHLRRRVEEQGYAVVVVAEGAGEELMESVSAETDASGNKKLPAIGEFMKQKINDYFKAQNDVATVKYIDPSYTIRSVPANAQDSLYCMQLGQNAVHGAMAGFTGFSVGLINNRMVFLPIPELVATSPRTMNPRGRTWERILALTRQPNTVPPLAPGEKDPFAAQPEVSLR